MELIKFIFSGFWIFFGTLCFVFMFSEMIIRMWQSFLKYLTIRKHGYPPEYYEMDGVLEKFTNKLDEND